MKAARVSSRSCSTVSATVICGANTPTAEVMRSPAVSALVLILIGSAGGWAVKETSNAVAMNTSPNWCVGGCQQTQELPRILAEHDV